jgi:thioredoxin-like negative regulator of GroEL
MKVRSLLIATALVSSILGALAGYLVLTVPNDIAGGALLRQARDNIQAGRNAEARSKLSRVVQQYPRTDAAAAATVALADLEDSERQKLAAELARARREAAAQRQQLDAVTQKVNQLTSTPPAAPVAVVAPQPEPPPPVVKKAPPKKPAHKKRRTRHRR